jgi:hypothetical protein
MACSHRTDIATRVEKRDSQTSFLKFQERGLTVMKLDQAKLIALTKDTEPGCRIHSSHLCACDALGLRDPMQQPCQCTSHLHHLGNVQQRLSLVQSKLDGFNVREEAGETSLMEHGSECPNKGYGGA